MKNHHNLLSSSHNRRNFLKGAGVSLLLPQMASIAGDNAYKNPTRMAFLHVPNGMIMDKWTPKKVGKDFEITQTLKSVAKFKNDLQVISGLQHKNGFSNGDGAGDHARAQGSFLTGVQILKSAKAVKNGISVDQVAAQKAGHKTYLPSLELSTKRGRLSGSCDSGYSCMYQFNLSWRNAKEPMVPESSAQLAFNRMFVLKDAKNGSDIETGKSILDYMRGSAKSLKSKLAKEDIHKLDQYFDSLRELERKASKGKHEISSKMLDRDFNAPPKNYADKIETLMDLMVLAWEVDATRICSMIIADEGSNMSFPELGVNSGHHSLSHHQNDPDKIKALEKIDNFYTTRFAYFLQKLSQKKVNGSSLLDQSMVLYGSGISDGNKHRHNNLPIVLAGHANGKLQPGQHRVYKDAPMSNLFVNMLDTFGTPVKSFSDSNGRLAKI
ncbi:MAG: DUF1552 domain-containing protein [Lentisphaeraceae bacterium]|nr:DUF1552 domain-containing protein [Lentisphaeraceae bacterium]